MIIFIKKSWLNFVPAVAARQRRQVLFIFIRFKRFVDCININYTRVIIGEEDNGIYYVMIEYINIIRTGNCENIPLLDNWHWETKAW